MKYILPLILSFSTIFFSFQQVDEVNLSLLETQWRLTHKIVEGEKEYNLRYDHSKGHMVKDDQTIYNFSSDRKFIIQWEDTYGNVTPALESSSASWFFNDIEEKTAVVINDVYYSGCPEMILEIRSLSETELILFELNQNVGYAFTKK